METESQDRSYLCDTHREEVASIVTHAAGMVFSVGLIARNLLFAWGA